MNNSPEQEEKFLENLGLLHSAIEELDCTCISIFAAWNADISNEYHLFGKHVKQFCNDTGLALSSQLKLPGDSFTYKSDSWHTTSWLDHCISTSHGHAVIQNMEVLYCESTGDHVPFWTTVLTNCIPALEDKNSDPSPRLDWSRVKIADINNYTAMTDCLLKEVRIPIKAVNCKNVNCRDETHAKDLNVFSESLLGSLTSAGSRAFPDASRAKNFKCRPGWSEYVDELHKAARESFVMW